MPTEVDAPAKAVDGNAEENDLKGVFNFEGGERKKKSKTKGPKTGRVEPTEGPVIDGTGKEFVRGPLYPYTELLARIHELVELQNPNLQSSRKYTVKPPQLSRVGSKKVAWTNFKEICGLMERNPDHLLQFVLAELGTEGSIGGDGHLTLKGKFGTKHIESLLRKYITEYVICSMCKSPHTSLSRDNSTRLFNINCSACGASRSVSAIRTGFHAVSRADRRKAKQAA